MKFRCSTNYIDPGTLNACLTQNKDGYVDGCYMPHNDENKICAPSGVLWEGRFEKKISDRINDFLNSGFPVIAKVHYSGADNHFVVVVGKREKKWNIFDPLDGHLHMKETKSEFGDFLAVYLFSQW